MSFTHGGDLFGKLCIELHIEIPHQMIPFLAAAFGGDTFAETFISEHGFADVYPPVIDQIDLNDFVTDAFEKGSEGHTEGIVPHMPQVLRLVGVGGGKLNKDFPSAVSGKFDPLHKSFNIGGACGKESGRGQSDIDKCLDSSHIGNIGMGGKKSGHSGDGALRTAAEFGDLETVDGKIPLLPRRTGFKNKGVFSCKGRELGPQCGLQIFKELHNIISFFYKVVLSTVVSPSSRGMMRYLPKAAGIRPLRPISSSQRSSGDSPSMATEPLMAEIR